MNDKPKAAPKKTGAAKPTFKYTVADLARKLDASGAETRRRLRALTKAGKLEHSPGTRYGWNDDKSFNEVIALLKAKPEPAPKKPAAKKVSRGSVKK